MTLHRYNRRQFLQLTGIALVGTQIPRSLAFFHQLAPKDIALQGRALSALTVYAHPAAAAPAVGQLWPDSVVTLVGETGDWYQTLDGYVSRAEVQPMKPVSPTDTVTQFSLPFWAEVAGAVASVRQFCAANAPLVTRIGHGGVARVIDFMPDQPTPWYGIASANGTLLGWTPAASWQQVAEPETTPAPLNVEIHSSHNRLVVYKNGQAVLEAPCSTNGTLRPGTYLAQERQVGGTKLETPALLEGVPWRVIFGDFDLAGVYWHNQFGQIVPGPAVQVTPLLAQSLYTASTITVI